MISSLFACFLSVIDHCSWGSLLYLVESIPYNIIGLSLGKSKLYSVRQGVKYKHATSFVNTLFLNVHSVGIDPHKVISVCKIKL